MAEFHLRIVASDKVFYSGMTEIVILPGLDGSMHLWQSMRRWSWQYGP